MYQIYTTYNDQPELANNQFGPAIDLDYLGPALKRVLYLLVYL